MGRKPLSFSKRAPWTARPLFHVWGEPPDLNRHRPGSRPGAFPIKLGSPVFWRRLRGSNPHTLPGITGFKPDKHASLASLRNWRCGPELNRHRLDRQSRALPLSYRTGKRTTETTSFAATLLAGVPADLPDDRCPFVHGGPAETGADVSGHDCLFGSVAVHSSYVPTRQFTYREPCELRMGATQPCGVPPRPLRLRLRDRRITRELRP